MVKAFGKDFRVKEEYHFNDLPRDIYVELDREFLNELCRTVNEINLQKYKHQLGKTLGIPDWKIRRIWSGKNRVSIELLERLRVICEEINPIKFSIENAEKSIVSIGTHADKRIYYPKFPFKLIDLVYAYSHFIFDGSVRYKGSYFLAFEKDLLYYHKERLKIFGIVETNFINKEKQLYIPWILPFVIKELFHVNSFTSLEAKVPKELKQLAMKDISIANEIIKAAITDDGWIEDKISFSVSNEQLSRDVWEITKAHYEVGKFPDKPRERIGISGKMNQEWKWSILSKSLKEIHENIKFPLNHKQERLEFAIKRQNRKWYKRKPNETKKLIIKSLLEKPKSTKELCFELDVRSTSILNLINGIHCKSQNTKGLKELGIVDILEYRINTPGERNGKFPIYFIKNKEKAGKFIH